MLKVYEPKYSKTGREETTGQLWLTHIHFTGKLLISSKKKTSRGTGPTSNREGGHTHTVCLCETYVTLEQSGAEEGIFGNGCYFGCCELRAWKTSQAAVPSVTAHLEKQLSV